MPYVVKAWTNLRRTNTVLPSGGISSTLGFPFTIFLQAMATHKIMPYRRCLEFYHSKVCLGEHRYLQETPGCYILPLLFK